MTLFRTQSGSTGSIVDVARMVEHYFKERGLDPKRQAISDAEGCGWWLNEGSARVYIYVQDGPAGITLRITSPIVYIPKDRREEFFHHLLELNANLTYCALAIVEDTVLVVTQRQTVQLDQEELDAMIWSVAYVADLLDDKLANAFNTPRFQS